MKAFITGITGFAGSHLAEYLLSKNIKVYGTFLYKHELSTEDYQKKVKLFHCDINNEKLLQRIIADVKPGLVFHLAAQTFVPAGEKFPLQTLNSNIYGTLNLLQAVSKFSLSAHILIVGSAEEYGKVKIKDLPLREDSPLKPITLYSVSKVASDMLGYYYSSHKKLWVVRVRPFNHTGARQSPRFVCSSLAYQIARIEKGKQEPVLKVGNTSAKRDFTDVRDIASAYFLALTKGKSGEIYNICSGKTYSIAFLLKEFLKISQRKIKIEKDPFLQRSIDIPVLLGSPKLFKKQTGWNPKFTIQQTLKDLLDYWRAHV